MDDCPIRIILLSGTPGTGKTSVAKLCRENFGWKILNLGEYIIENKLFDGRPDGINDTYDIDDLKAPLYCFTEVLKFISEQIKNINKNRDNKTKKLRILLIDSHYADIIIDGMNIFFSKKTAKSNIFETVSSEQLENICFEKLMTKEIFLGIILRCEPTILEKRLSERGYPENKALENIQAEIMGNCTADMLEVLGIDQIYEIDTSEFDIVEIPEIIHSILYNKKDFRNIFRAGKINWLERFIDNPEYQKYFDKDLGMVREYSDLEDFMGDKKDGGNKRT